MEAESVLEVNRTAIKHNLEALKAYTKKPVFAVLKADAYGLGALSIAEAIDSQVAGYCLALPAEGLALRSRTQKPILVFGYVPESVREDLVQAGLAVILSSLEEGKAWNALGQKLGKKVRVHLALDTGHHRVGFPAQDPGALDDVEALYSLPYLSIQGIYSHFSRADEPPEGEGPIDLRPEKRDFSKLHPFTQKQWTLFANFCQGLERRGRNLGIRHLANDAGLLTLPEDRHWDAVRLGISLYGHYPSAYLREKSPIQLQIPYRWTAPVALVKWIGPGEGIGYGQTWIAQKPTKVATIQIGYADGYCRSLSNLGQVLIQGHRCPVLGRVCMDQIMVDVTEVEKLEEGAEVVLLGPSQWQEDLLTPLARGEAQPKQGISADEMAAWEGTISYEVLCRIGPRVQRKPLDL